MCRSPLKACCGVRPVRSVAWQEEVLSVKYMFPVFPFGGGYARFTIQVYTFR